MTRKEAAVYGCQRRAIASTICERSYWAKSPNIWRNATRAAA
jgi:hypothetical protein